MDQQIVHTSISSFKENFDQHHKNFFFNIKRVLKPTPNPKKTAQSKSFYVIREKNIESTPKANKTPIKIVSNTLKANSNILNQKDLVSQNHFRNLVNNGTLKNSYSKKMAKTIKKNEKKQTNFIEEGYSSETNTNFQDESKVNNNYENEDFHCFPHIMDEYSNTNDHFAEKIMQESKKMLRNTDFSCDLTNNQKVELEIASKTLELLQRENSLLKNENEELHKENAVLKNEIYGLKNDMNNTIEERMFEQKTQIQGVIEEYKKFISKLMNDKKELSINCEKLMKENCLLNESKRNYSENDMDILKSYETKTNEEKDKFLKEIESLNKKIKQLTEDVTAKTKTSVFSSDFQEKTLLSAKISDLELELRNYKEKISSLSAEYFEKIGEKEAEYYRSYNSLEIQVNNALKKKDDVIKKLNFLLEKK